LACDSPEENARRRASDATAYARPWSLLTTREIRYAEAKSVDAKEKSPLSALPIVNAGVFFADAKDFFVMEKSFVHHASNVRVDAANRMHHE
jgi:hypothetical protein